jgi:2-polyprenyl-3-methyl-5-hydroxy-6-metoxy-1,4-benzoquinol methylase
MFCSVNGVKTLNNRIVVYTAIFDDYDVLHDPECIPENVDFVVFTDTPILSSSVWKIRQIEPPCLDFTRASRHFKLLPHRYFPEYITSLWIDGNVILRGNINELINKYLVDTSMAVFSHVECADKRNCVYEEYAAIIDLGKKRGVYKDNPEVMQQQIERYKQAGYPEHNGLVFTSVLLRRHQEPALIKCMEDWWQELCDGSKRDQLSFNYVAWKNGFHFNYINGDLISNEYLYTVQHNKKLQLIGDKKTNLTKIKINLSAYDFIDFGCSKGGSIEFAKQYLGGKNGLGIDIDISKVELTISMGYDALQGDLTNLELPDKCVDFVIISHMLEHLPDQATCKAVLASAVRVARKFVYIQGPWFDADRYLALIGLKMTWSDWSGHTLHLTTKILSRMLNTLECKNVLLFGRKLIESTDDPFIIPIQSPKNCQQYESEYGWKPSVIFNCPIYKDIVSIIPAEGFDIDSLKESIAPVAQTLFSLNTISNNIQNIYTLTSVYDMLNLIRESSNKEKITTNPVLNKQLERINKSSLQITKLKNSETAIKELQLWLLKAKTWRYLRYLHAKTALSLIENDIKTVLVIGAGHGIAELILALEYPHINFYLTDHKLSTHNISIGKNFISTFGIKNVSFGELDILYPNTYNKFDLVYSVEVLEHIKDDFLAVKNMHVLSEKYIYCLVPFAEEVLNKDPERLAHSLKKAEHHLVGYNLLRLVNLFPNIFVIRGCYWKNAGVEFRGKLELLDQEQIILEQESLMELAKQDLIDRIPLKMREGMGIWCLAKSNI